MQSIQTLVNNQKQKFSGTQSQEHSTEQNTKPRIDELSQRRIDRLFAILGGIYGLKWTSQYPSMGSAKIAQIEWSNCVNHLSDEQIKIGLQKCRGSDGKFAPSAPEFVQMCKPAASIQSQMYKEFKALARPDSCPELAKSALKKIREVLGKPCCG